MSRLPPQTIIRRATPADDLSISKLLPLSSQESKIFSALHATHNLHLHLIATTAPDPQTEPEIIGLVAFSPVSLLAPEPASCPAGPFVPTLGWFALGPIYVAKTARRRGVGTALIRAGLEILEQGMVAPQSEGGDGGGVVAVGFPSFYRRVGFVHDAAVTYDGAPEQYFLVRRSGGEEGEGNRAGDGEEGKRRARYCDAFGGT